MKDGILAFCFFAAAACWGGGRVVTDLSGSGWTCDGESVSIPHTWNAEDAADGPGDTQEPRRGDSAASRTSYLRTRKTYRRKLPDPKPGRRSFVRFEGASTVADVSVNGVRLGRHVGAFTAFAFEVTNVLTPEDNVLEVAVDNRLDESTQPLSADFSVYGGLYRKVWMIETDPVCIDPVTDGANGIRVCTDPKTGEATFEVRVLGGTNEIRKLKFEDFELWSPEHPKVYRHRVELSQGGSSDAVDVSFAFRSVEFREDGFYLNGQRRQLKGVNRHQDRQGKGWALSPADEEEDIRLIKEMGADALRTAHYPQSQHVYDLCDKLGLICWVEYPNVNRLVFSGDFERNVHRQVREMVAQLRNHPSIAVWSIWNELEVNGNGWSLDMGRSVGMLERLRDLLHGLDRSRPVAAAADRTASRPINDVSDQLAFNQYPGWYSDLDMRTMLDALNRESGRAVYGISEYGIGASVRHHGEPSAKPTPKSAWHPEEYQAYRMHDSLLQMTREPRVWGHFVWAMFDFGADRRMEGDAPGINDKGLVTYDRKVKKDAYYLYRASWTKTPVLHLVGSRMTEVGTNRTTVVAFSNVGSVELRINGDSLGVKEPDSCATVIWPSVRLSEGVNHVEIRSGGLSRTAKWTSAF